MTLEELLKADYLITYQMYDRELNSLQEKQFKCKPEDLKIVSRALRRAIDHKKINWFSMSRIIPKGTVIEYPPGPDWLA